MPATVHDLLIVGGGINGAGIARDAAGRGLSVLLCEQGDLGGATSSASSKMIHGGLRYLEYHEFRLVAEALAEREVMLRIAPHLTRPLRFIMPHVPSLRPAWMIRLGLLLYDSLGRIGGTNRRVTLPGSASIDLTRPPIAQSLQEHYGQGYVYSDVAVDDARLTLANARAAFLLGAGIRPRSRFIGATRVHGLWQATLENADGTTVVRSRALVNAAGPWVAEVCAALPAGTGPRAKVQLVKGSHIVVPRLYPGEHAFILQNDDRRVIFLLPFEEKFTLIGTTDVRVEKPGDAGITADEVAYLCRAASRYTRTAVAAGDIVWRYSGVRPLFDDGQNDPSRVSRDYTFVLDQTDHVPALSIFGGKITTYRRLAEKALARLAPWFPHMGPSWTDHRPLPGGDFATLAELVETLQSRHPALPPAWLKSLARRHGTEAVRVIGDARSAADLGLNFGGGLYQREVEYFIEHEWAKSADDILWRRSKAGLLMTAAEQDEFHRWLQTT